MSYRQKYKTCRSCKTSFYSAYNNYCKKCHFNYVNTNKKFIKVSLKKCVICHESFVPTNKDSLSSWGGYIIDHNKDNKCVNCWGCEIWKCIECGNNYKHNKNDTNRCYDCNSVRLSILNNNKPPSTKINQKFQIKITYEVDSQSHDGYCSDPGETSYDTYKYSVILPLWKGITNDDIDSDGNIIDVYTSGVSGYYKKDDTGHGNGYCGLETTYTIKKAKVINIKKSINL